MWKYFSPVKQPVQSLAKSQFIQTKLLKIDHLFFQGVLLKDGTNPPVYSLSGVWWTLAYCQPDLIQFSPALSDLNKFKYKLYLLLSLLLPTLRRGVFRKEYKLLRKILLKFHIERHISFFLKSSQKMDKIHYFQFYNRNQVLSKAVI